MKYVFRKITTLIITLFCISVLTFLIFQVIPGDAVTSILGTEATPEREEALKKELGFDKPLAERYLNWITGVVKGDLGKSYRYSENINERMEVSRLIGDKLPVTLWLALLSLLFIIVLSFPLGIFWAKTKKPYLDAVFGVISQVFMAIPSFFLGILIIFIFGLTFHFFTPGGYVSYRDNFAGFLAYLIFPAFAVAIPKIAMAVRFFKDAMVKEMKSDYVRTAYSKGNTVNRVMYFHVLKNALIPVVTFMGMIAAEIIAGSIVAEQVFGLPGIGRLLIGSISARDFPVVQILVLYISFVVIFVYFLVDILYKLLDPRIE